VRPLRPNTVPCKRKVSVAPSALRSCICALPKNASDRATFVSVSEFPDAIQGETAMHSIIYIIGLIVVIMAVLSFFGLR
jgi:hypothetical protein